MFQMGYHCSSLLTAKIIILSLGGTIDAKSEIERGLLLKATDVNHLSEILFVANGVTLQSHPVSVVLLGT